MKRIFTKSISVALMCMLLTVMMIFSGCNSGSSATNFFQSAKEATDVKMFDFEVEIDAESDGQDATIAFSGTYNSPESMSMSASVSSNGMTIDIGEVILDGSRLYIDLSTISSLASMAGGSTADLFDGKSYLYFDIEEIASLAEMSGAEMPFEVDDLGAYQGLVDVVTDKILEVLEKAAVETEPAVLSQDGGKFTLTINDDNIVDFVRNLVDVIADEEDWILETLPAECEKVGLDIVAEAIYDSEDDISDAIAEMVEGAEEDPGESFEEIEFELVAYSEMINQGGRSWNFGIEFEGEANGTDASMGIDMTIKENAGIKPITKVDENDAISYMDLMMSSMSSYYDN